MNARVDFSGFQYRTDRIQTCIDELLEDLLKTYPDLTDIGVQVKRSFFGTYSALLCASVDGHHVETHLQGTDPEDCAEDCFEMFHRNVSDLKRRQGLTTTGREPRSASCS